MKLTFAVRPFSQPSQETVTVSPYLICGQQRLRREEAELEILRRQQRHHRAAWPARFRPAGNRSARWCRRRDYRRCGASAGSPTRPDWPWPGATRLRHRRRSFACRPRVFSNSLARSKFCCALTTAVFLTTTSAFCRSSSTVNSRSPFLTWSPSRTFTVSTRPCSSGRNENQLGLDPALQLAVVAFVAAGEREAGEHQRRHDGKLHPHGALLGANNSSTWVFIILRTSSGSKRSNNPLQMMATRPGAAMICGNSASACGHLAARGGAAQQRAHRGDDAREHLAVIEFGELGEAAAFRDHQPDHVLAPRLVDLAHEQFDDLVAEHADRHVGRAQRLDGADQRREHGADQFLEQALLVAEVEIDRALGDAGALGHVVEPRRLEAAGGEFIERRGKDRLAAGGAALPDARCCAAPARRDAAAAPRGGGAVLCGRIAGARSSWRYLNTD